MNRKAAGTADRDAVEFMPDADAVLNAAMPGWAKRGMLWMLGFFLFFLIWAAIGRVDVVVPAKGRLVSDHPTIVMKPLERTVVKEILVHVGDRVEKGQELVLFDPVFSRADVERLSAQKAVESARLERLRAEFAGTDWNPSGQTPEEQVQFKLFQERRRFLMDKEDFYAHEIGRISRSRDSYAANLDIQRSRLKDMGEIESIMTRGGRSGAVSRREVLATRLERRQLDADVRDKENALRILDSELASKQAERSAFRRDWFISLAGEMVKAEEDLNTVLKELEKASQLAGYTALRAPEAAVVHEIMPVARGSAIREAETILTLVPLDGKLEAEAEIKAEDIGRVRKGDSVRVKLTAFPFQKYGTLDGKVRVISEDAFPCAGTNPQREGAEGGSTGGMVSAGGACYRTRIAFTGKESGNYGLLQRTIPGMEAEADIRTGTRSIIGYFTYPLVKAFDESIREP